MNRRREKYSVVLNLQDFIDYKERIRLGEAIGVPLIPNYNKLIPLSLALALGTMDSRIAKALHQTPELIERGRTWGIPDQVEHLDQQFRMGLTQPLTLRLGTSTFTVQPLKSDAPMATTSDAAQPALEALILKLYRERDDARRLAEERGRQRDEALTERDQFAIRLEETERAFEEMVMQSKPMLADVPAPAVRAAINLFPGLKTALQELPISVQ